MASNFSKKLARADGRAYGAFILTMIAIVFLTFILPNTLTLVATVSTKSASSENSEIPLQNMSSIIAPHGGGVYWGNFTDGTPSPIAISGMVGSITDCEPFDGTTDGVFPVTEANWPRWDDAANNKSWVSTGMAFRDSSVLSSDPLAAFNLCSTLNDEFSFRLNSTLGFSLDHNLAMTRFNASLVKFNCFGCNLQYNATYTQRVNYTWHVTINGERVFGDDISAADGDSSSFSRTTCFRNCSYSGIQAGDARYYPTVKMEHDLSIDETYRVRELLAKQNPNSVDVRVHFKCYGSSVTTGLSDCAILENGLVTSSADTFYFNYESEYVDAGDWQLLIKGMLILLSIAMAGIAVASTPAYNPVKDALGRLK